MQISINDERLHVNEEVFKGALMDVDDIAEAKANATLDNVDNKAYRDT